MLILKAELILPHVNIYSVIKNNPISVCAINCIYSSTSVCIVYLFTIIILTELTKNLVGLEMTLKFSDKIQLK